ncbi:MAG: hypothetical protein O7D30_03755, partial [Rickettsia endosymbiont of Ixodes persulcatus]|nr:hypothetical protein [Rickettsia endosymbiont of Ixodes persulcatus]
VVRDLNIDTFKQNESVVCDYLTLVLERGMENTITRTTSGELFSGNSVAYCIDNINDRVLNTSQ